ncbi:MAG TPA: O-antigen ligase family protein, partial [Vicinamibacteria bacterium]|nr:O-antigen ligase family protein [Vicinamibacteria bacterium]
FLGFDHIDRRPRSFMGHYMTASGLIMGVLLLGAARLVFEGPPRRPSRREVSLPRLALDGPILAFVVWTLLSASFSPEPVVSHQSAKKLLLFVLLYVAVDTLADRDRRDGVLEGALLGGLALAAGALLQYYFLGFDHIDRRPRSFMGHYMTASGLLMGVLLLGAARLVFEGVPRRPRRDELALLGAVVGGMALLGLLQRADLFAVEGERIFVAAVAAMGAHQALVHGRQPPSRLLAAAAVVLSSWALVMTLTRNAWLGALAGLLVIGLMRTLRVLWIVAAAVAAVLVLQPPTVIARLTITDLSSRDRWFMWQAGIDMIADKPVFGQGPRMVEAVYPGYRWPGAPNPATPHLHNNVLQIAAERGLPCLAFWLWWMASALADAYRELRRGGPGSWTAAAALALLTALLAAGMFEYNFGDSEVLMFALLLTALPYALRRQRRTEREAVPLAPTVALV